MTHNSSKHELIHRLLLATLLATVCVACHGCARHMWRPPWAGRRSAEFIPLPPAPFYRILVVAAGNRSEHVRADRVAAEMLRSELQATGRFEVVAAPDVDSVVCEERSLDELLTALPDVARASRPDLILLCTVTEYRPYPPMTVGLSVRLVSAVDASTVAAIDSVWTAPADVEEGRPGAPLFWFDRTKHATNLGIVAHSPDHFVRSVAAEVAGSLARSMAPSALPPLPSPSPSPSPDATVIESGSSVPPEFRP